MSVIEKKRRSTAIIAIIFAGQVPDGGAFQPVDCRSDMVFSSPIFLFGFLPLALFFYYLSPKSAKNIILLSFSLLFYAWGEIFYVGVMLVSIVSNFFFGMLIHGSRERSGGNTRPKIYLALGIAVNLALLIYFKYANFISDNIDATLAMFDLDPVALAPVHLPLGISFFTFQAISYIVDVYREEAPVGKNICDIALYISSFPQLIAGPIIRYNDVSRQIADRSHSTALFADGAKRFIYGLAKKMLIANPLGEAADSVFSFSGSELGMPLAWIGICAYTLQIYFDFSGYSDMAIGLGKMFGFRFQENFNYPYISTSVREFWRRWHISLSTWFKNYVYIPLGGGRAPAARVHANLLIVFVLTGFWHGASWNFLIWGLFHGFFLILERAGFSDVLNRAWRPLRHMYLLSVVVAGWVFFRAETLPQALDYLHSMVDVSNFRITSFQYARVLSNEAIFAFFMGSILSTPVYPSIKKYLAGICGNNVGKSAALVEAPGLAVLCSLLILSILKIASSTYNPFIYFRF